jgi:HK97 family phage major capsid protein
VDRVVEAKSVAFQVGTVVDTQLQTIRFPVWTADPTAGWFAENTTITLSDPSQTEIVVTPTKVAGRTQISNEALTDSDPSVDTQIGNALARDIAKRVDAAFFASTTSNGPSGLLSLSAAYQVVDTGNAWTSLDHFHNAKYEAIAEGAELTHVILAPDVALALALAKEATGSNKSLFENVADGVTLAGLAAVVSPHVAAGNAWAVDSSQILTVRRAGTTVVTDSSAAFGDDATQIRATSRIGFGFANPAGVVRLHDAS